MKKVAIILTAFALLVGASTIFPPNDTQTAASDPFDPMM